MRTSLKASITGLLLGAFTMNSMGAVFQYNTGTTIKFAPSSTIAGINVGSVAGDPSAPLNGDIWYDSTANELTARINGANVALGSGSGSGNALTTDPLSQFAATTSAQLKSVLSDELGDASGKAIFALGTLAIASGKTLTSSNTITLAGTDGSTLNIGAGGTLGAAALLGASAGGNGTADNGKAAIFGTGGIFDVTTELTVHNSANAAHAYLSDDGTLGFQAVGETNPRELAFPSDVLEGESKEIATKNWVNAQGFGGTLTSTYVGYGSGANALTGEAAFNYTAASDLLTVPNITVSGTATLGTLDITTLNATALQLGGVGVTSSAAELNYTTGVTSPIQAQIDTKAASTSPAITTSITTPSTTFALANTTATTVNAFGAATTLNIGASAATVLNLGGSTSSAELRFLEPSGSGTNYTGLKAQAQAGNVTYTLPAADGSSGQVLSTNGTGALSWATAGGLPASPTFGDQIMTNGTAGFNGNLSSVFEFKEEFVTASAANPFGPWQKGGTVATDFNFGDQNHWGVVRNRSTSVAVQAWYTGINHFNFGASTALLEWIIKTPSNSGGAAAVSDGTDTYTMVVGFGDSFSAAAQTDGCYFRYNHAVNSGKWERVTESNTSEEALDTGITFAGNTWYRLGIKVINATSVEFFINGSSVGTNSTGANIPNGAGRETGLMYMCDRTAGTAERNMYVDACRLVMIPTTPR